MQFWKNFRQTFTKMLDDEFVIQQQIKRENIVKIRDAKMKLKIIHIAN